MGMVGDIISGIGDLVSKGVDTGYSIYQDQRNYKYQTEQDQRNYDESVRQYNQNYDENVRQYNQNFDYNKALQQQIFDREDTAVQRRMADLESAGLNPNLAAGSGAGAGSVVSQSAHGVSGQSVGSQSVSGNQVKSLGGVLDTFQALQSMKQSREMTESIQLQNESKVLENLYKKYEFSRDFGITPKSIALSQKNGRDIYTLNNYFDYSVEDKKGNKKFISPLENSPVSSRFNYDINSLNNKSKMLQFETDNMVLSYVSDLLFGGLNAVSKFKR